MQSSVCDIAQLRTMVVAPTDQPQALVVLLHGYAMRPEDLEPFAHSMTIPVRFYFPQALHATTAGKFAWWPIDTARRTLQLENGPRDLAEEYPSGREAARQTLYAFIHALHSLEPGLPLILGGFSQGGMLACDAVLHSEAMPVDGLFMLSSSRLAIGDWLLKKHRLRDLKVLLSHGKADRDLAFSAGVALRDFHHDCGAQVTWVPFNDGHEIPLVVWRALRAFLLQFRAA